jgi:DNA-binding LacI/PurR family transcriptional regulator
MTQVGKIRVRTRLQDIAKKLEISASSVSLALGEETSGRVSSDLRARIVETARAMNYVGRANGEFLYRQVAQSIGRRIRKGELKCGRRLASMDDLAAKYGVSKITIRRAFLELESEGLLSSQPAQGTYISPLFLSDGIRLKSKVLTVGLVSSVVLLENPGPYHSEILASLRAEISDRRGNLVVLPIPRNSRDISGQLRHANLDAVIYAGSLDPAALRSAVRNGPPAVLVDFHVRWGGVDQVFVDNVGGGEIAILHLLSLGHRDIAIIRGPEEVMATRERLAGVHRAMERAAIPLSTLRFVSGNFLRESGYQAMASLLKTSRRPTAVFCMNDEMAVGAIQAIHSLSALKVPRDISILGFDDITWAAATYPRLTTVRVDKKLMGKLAMERLISLLEGPRHKIASSTITPELLKRESTAPPPRLQSDQCPPLRERAESFGIHDSA